jgi:uncharacterized protein YdeI (YjbR/CyaY-like superfamily)
MARDDRLRTFSSAREFRAWLRAHHRTATDLLVRCYKVFWVMEGKREETRLRRLQELIERSARGEAIKPLAGKSLRTAGSS